ncbi:MAG: ribosome biogenesis GTPase Der [Phycisphaerae bacterium]|jgi:GTP-binding protein
MALPIVAIIGRPNVGKSSLLNALAGQMISIVEPTAGVTRDRVSVIIENNERFFELVDTGGWGIVDSDQLKEHVENQIKQAMGSASLVLFVVDIRDGLTPLDQQIAKLLRKNNLKVILVANKADEVKMFPAAADFAKLGFGDAFCISVTNNLNKSILVEKILETLEGSTGEKPKEVEMKIAIVGKRNAGKSTFTNAIAGEERVIVSEIPGTTRDSVDVRFEKDGKTFVVIDTAGVRRKSQLSDSIEFYSSVRAERSIRRADVVLLLIDATEPLSNIDKKLASFIGEEYKPCILVVNKWDLAVGKASSDDYADYIGKIFPQLSYAPIAFTTATESKNIQSVLDLACELYKQSATKISTAKMNKAVEEINTQRIGGRNKTSQLPKVYYATQIAVKPVTILLFVNNVDLFDENYKRFFISKLRDILSFSEVPIRLFVRPRRKEEQLRDK